MARKKAKLGPFDVTVDLSGRGDPGRKAPWDDGELSAAQQIAAQAAAAAVARAERALGIGASLAEVARERMPEVGASIAEAARQRSPEIGPNVTADLVPTLRDVAQQAATAALDLWQAARERVPEVKPGGIAETVEQAAQRVAAEGEKRAKEVSAAVADRAHDLGDRAQDLGDRAKGASRRTAEATVDTGRETGAFLFWLGAALGIIFWLLLSPERREQLTRLAGEAGVQVREIIRDFQGYDDEF